MSDDPFFRFPICLFSFADTPGESMHAILDWCIWDVGGKPATINQIEDNEAKKIAKETWGITGTPYAAHRRMARGVKVLHVTGGNVEKMIERANHVDSFNRTGSPWATIRNDLFWRAFHTANDNMDKLDGAEFPWDNFRVFAAVLSKIGTKKFAPCGWQEIQARAAGYPGKAIYKNADTGRPDLELSRRRIRTILAHLEEIELLARFQYSRGPRGGQSVFAMGIPVAEARDKFLTKKKAAREAIQRRREADIASCQSHRPSTGQGAANINRETVQNGENRPTLIAPPENRPSGDHGSANPPANNVTNPATNINERSPLTREGLNERSSLTKESLSTPAQARADEPETDLGEPGYEYKGEFIPSKDVNAYVLSHQSEMEAILSATPCRRLNGVILK